VTFIENSILVTGVATIIALALGVPAGYAFSRLRFRGRDTWASTILSFRYMPPVAVAIPIYLMIRYLSLVNSDWGLILPYVAFSLPLVVWIMIGFFDEIPREIDDAALVDGCSHATVLLRVLLPLVRPGIMVAATFGVIFIWNEFLVGLYIISSQDKQTIPIAAAGLLTTESPIDWNIAAAVGVLTVIPILIFSVFVQRYIVRGITAGAVR
jgi:multiple sugar transport system permease protein